jgi:hypothetical protein
MGLDSKTQVTWEGTLEKYHLVEALTIFWKCTLIFLIHYNSFSWGV